MKEEEVLTLGLDVAVDDPRVVQIRKTFQHLQRVHHDDGLVFDTAMLQQTSQRATRAVLHEDVHLVPVGLDAVVRDNVGVVQDLQYAHLVLDLRDNRGDELGVLEADLLDGHEVARIEVHSSIDRAEGAASNELALLPSQRDVGRRSREIRERTVSLVGVFEHSAQRLALSLLLFAERINLFESLHPLGLRHLDRLLIVFGVLRVQHALAHDGVQALPLSLRGDGRPGAHDIKVRDQHRHAACYLGTQLRVLVVADGEDVLAASHHHGKLEGNDGPSERLAVRCHAVVADEADPVQRQPRQLDVVHGSAVVVHVQHGTLAELGRESEAGLDEVLTVKTDSLLAHDLDAVHDGVGELVRRLLDLLQLGVDARQVGALVDERVQIHADGLQERGVGVGKTLLRPVCHQP